MAAKKYIEMAGRAFGSHALLLIFATASATVLFVSVYSIAVNNFLANTSERNVTNKLRVAAIALAKMATAEELGSYREASDVDRPDYMALRQKLIEFAEDADVKYAYYARVEGNKLQFIVDNDLDEETRSGIDTDPEELSENPEAEIAMAGKVYVSQLGIYADKWPGLISGYAPVMGSDGQVAALAGVDIDDREIMKMQRSSFFLICAAIASVIVVIGSGTLGFIKLRREAKEAKNADAAKSRFLSRMSHEIRTPMNAVIGMSDLVAINYGKPKGLEYVAQIKQAGANMLTIINGILDLSAVESGKIQINNVPYGAASMLSDVLSIIRIRMKDKKGIQLHIDIDQNTPGVIIGDETRVKEILLNLLTNAVKYTNRGFIKFRLISQIENADKIVWSLEVSDSGIGIKPKDINRLFMDFSRAEDKYTSNIEGTGLGLSIARLLCHAMGGDVKVESKYGEGSKFTATIKQQFASGSPPIGRFEDVQAIDAIETVTVSFIAPEFRVLIVDDLATNLKVAEGLLEPYKMKTDSCMSGNEALELIQENEYDLVLMDHMMPEMDGLEAVAAIRALGGQFDKLPIVALTANAVSGMRDMFLKKGFNDFLSKPIEMPKLTEIIDKWVPLNKRVLGDRRVSADRRGPVAMWRRPKGQAETKLPVNSLAKINGLDAAKGIAATGGTEASYKEVLKLYCREVGTRVDFLNASYAKSNLKNFITQVHALKSASATIGAAALSLGAKDLEDAGGRSDLTFIGEHIDKFRTQLSYMVELIAAALDAEENDENKESCDKPLATEIAPAMIKLKEALNAEDVRTADECIAELSAMALDDEVSEAVSRASDMVLTSDFKEAAGLIGDIVNRARH